MTDLEEAYRTYEQAARLTDLHFLVYWYGGGPGERGRVKAAAQKRGQALRRYQTLELSYGSLQALSPFTPAGELARLSACSKGAP